MDKVLLQFSVDCFEKAEEGDKSRRIGGYASTEKLDRQGEVLIQKGLDFTDFLKNGWFNDNHDRTTAGVVGYPTKAEFHEGKGWYVEGYLLKGYKKADDIWELATSLQKSDRRLGFSVEGGKATKEGNKIIKAMIRNVAVTHCPVNTECIMEVLSKSLCPHGGSECFKHDDCCVKALEAGYPQGTDTVDGGALIEQDLDKTKTKDQELECKKCKKCEHTEKSLLRAKEILEKISERGYSKSQVDVIYRKLKELEVIKTELEGE